MNSKTIQRILHKIRCYYCIHIKKDNIVEVKYRGIGKTTFLINYAKRHNYTVVYPTSQTAKMIKKEFNYANIISLDEALKRGIRPRRIVVDETMSDNGIKRLKKTNHTIILAYRTVDEIVLR